MATTGCICLDQKRLWARRLVKWSSPIGSQFFAHGLASFHVSTHEYAHPCTSIVCGGGEQVWNSKGPYYASRPAAALGNQCSLSLNSRPPFVFGGDEKAARFSFGMERRLQSGQRRLMGSHGQLLDGNAMRTEGRRKDRAMSSSHGRCF